MTMTITTTTTTTTLLGKIFLLCCYIIAGTTLFSNCALAFSWNGVSIASIPTLTTPIPTASTATERRDRGVLSAVSTSSSSSSSSNSKKRGTRIESKKDIERLLTQNRRVVNYLASMHVNNDEKNTDTDNDNDSTDTVVSELTRLRFAMAFDTGWEAKIAFREALEYRQSPQGKAIVEAAATAYQAATQGGEGTWKNDIVRAAAPHATVINQYVTSQSFVTVSTADGDLVYVIRASLIDDTKLMNQVSVTQLSDFFLYVKEIHHLVANQRSAQSGRLCEVIFANDITGVRKPPDKRFSKALSSSSAQYEKLYPSLAGPTMILNLPFLLQAFASLFKSLYPKSIQVKLKFLRAPVLGSLRDLTPLAMYKGRQKKAFLLEIEKLLKQ